MKIQLAFAVVCSCLAMSLLAADTSAPAPTTVPAAAPAPAVSPAPVPPAVPAAVPGYADVIPVVTPAAVAVQGLADGSEAAARAQAVYAGKTALPVEVKTKQAGIVLRLIPCGTFKMGSPETEPFHKDAEVLHSVTLTRPFYISATEVTEGEWKRVMGAAHGGPGVNEQLPVEKVTYQDCIDFLKKLCALEGVPEETYTLPTEAQWEYACRAGTLGPYYFGATLEPTQAVFGKKNEGDSGRVPVRTFAPNAFGLYETHGNVAEWCKDWWEQAYQRVPMTDPVGAPPGEFKIVRGGAWDKAVTVCRLATRANLPPSYAWETVGFRIVRTLPLRAE
jgi:formylglycine-generating enzyme required for sulfatase activity